MASEHCEKNVVVTPDLMLVQKEFTAMVLKLVTKKYNKPKALVRTYGCQQNMSDGEKIQGMLAEMGYDFTEDTDEADLVLFNTCAIRAHAEDRVFGNVGALKSHKRRNPNMLIVLCGCMMQQQKVVDKIKKSHPHVDLVFGTHVIHRLPELIYKAHTADKRIFELPDIDGIITEGLPVHREGGVSGWLPIMYGCNNFCTYCIVPYVRGRERSRAPEMIINEAKEMIASGIKEITLLGQNVNSYNGNNMNFSTLLKQLNALEGDFRIRFLTSHPKDCTEELLETMSTCEKVTKHLHLPFQAGSNRVLEAMNRHYNKEKYLYLIGKAKELMPDITLTSDVIVGFPSEIYDEFLETLELIREVKFTSLYTFIFSSREGTPAATMEDPISRADKGKWFTELSNVQEEISTELNQRYFGKTLRVLCENAGREEGIICARTDGNIICEFVGNTSLIGEFAEVEITEALTYILRGKLL